MLGDKVADIMDSYDEALYLCALPGHEYIGGWGGGAGPGSLHDTGLPSQLFLSLYNNLCVCMYQGLAGLFTDKEQRIILANSGLREAQH